MEGGTMTAEKPTLGMVGSSTKENEERVAVHPAHFSSLDPETRKRLYVERGYGERFGIGDDEIEPLVAGLMEREELFRKCDVMMIFKPTEQDFPYLREGQVLWGALHLVQGRPITQTAIDKRLTCIAMESMFTWNSDGSKGVWLFHTQSELAGYCSFLHSMQLLGTKGWYDQPRKIAVLSFGSAGRGAVHAALALDYSDITVYTRRPPLAMLSAIPGVKYCQYVDGPRGRPAVRAPGGELTDMSEELSNCDVIVNCILQDTDSPFMFIYNDELSRFRSGTLIIDVSCDLGMGFEFARPTTFDEPMFKVGNGVAYYAVDHSPSYLYNTASLEHSKEAYPYVQPVMAGRPGWERSPTVGRAIEIDRGVIVNRKILTFQNRADEYPHPER